MPSHSLVFQLNFPGVSNLFLKLCGIVCVCQPPVLFALWKVKDITKVMAKGDVYCSFSHLEANI